MVLNTQYTKPGMKTKVYDVFNKENKSYLGRIGWYPSWRKYTFAPSAGAVFEATCLADITSFLNKLMEDRKQNRGPMKNFIGEYRYIDLATAQRYTMVFEAESIDAANDFFYKQVSSLLVNANKNPSAIRRDISVEESSRTLSEGIVIL